MIKLPLSKRKCLINKQQQEKQKNPSRPARGMYIIVSRRKTLHHTRRQESSHVSRSCPPLLGRREGGRATQTLGKKIKKNIGKFMRFPSRQTKLSKFNRCHCSKVSCSAKFLQNCSSPRRSDRFGEEVQGKGKEEKVTVYMCVCTYMRVHVYLYI